MSDAYKTEPYRVEWRAHLTTPWQLMTKHNTHEDAREQAQLVIAQYGGQSRVVTQHVTEVFGLGAATPA